jgi:recombinational DNA repair ATPase RecF
MYLKRIRASSFRAFGDGTAAPVLDWELSPGMNILVGGNDAGKTAVVDAIGGHSRDCLHFQRTEGRIGAGRL